MGWKKVKLGDVIFKKNLRLKDVEDINDPLVLGVTNNEGVVVSKVDAGKKIEDYYVIDKGDFIYNPYRINVGSIGISELEGITSLAYVVFNVDETKINKYLLLKFLKSEFGIIEIKKNGRGSVRNALRFDDLANIEITLSSIEKQNEFVEKYKKKEEIVESINNELTFQFVQLENLNQAILQEAVQGKLVPQDLDDEPATELLKRIKAEKKKEDNGKKHKPLPPIKPEEIPFEIPKSWVWCRLGEMSINRDEERKPISQAERNRRQKIYDYYGASGIIDKIDGYTHEGELLLVGEDGANLVTRSTPIAFIAKGKFWVNNHAHVLDALDRITLDYLCAYINSIDLKPFLTGGFQPKLNQRNLNIVPVPLPPLAEQKRIVAEIEKQLAEIEQLKECVAANQEATEQLLKALLQEAFEGE